VPGLRNQVGGLRPWGAAPFFSPIPPPFPKGRGRQACARVVAFGGAGQIGERPHERPIPLFFRPLMAIRGRLPASRAGAAQGVTSQLEKEHKKPDNLGCLAFGSFARAFRPHRCRWLAGPVMRREPLTLATKPRFYFVAFASEQYAGPKQPRRTTEGLPFGSRPPATKLRFCCVRAMRALALLCKIGTLLSANDTRHRYFTGSELRCQPFSGKSSGL
jgi:hypothetical protein